MTKGGSPHSWVRILNSLVLSYPVGKVNKYGSKPKSRKMKKLEEA